MGWDRGGKLFSGKWREKKKLCSNFVLVLLHTRMHNMDPPSSPSQQIIAPSQSPQGYPQGYGYHPVPPYAMHPYYMSPNNNNNNNNNMFGAPYPIMYPLPSPQIFFPSSQPEEENRCLLCHALLKGHKCFKKNIGRGCTF